MQHIIAENQERDPIGILEKPENRDLSGTIAGLEKNQKTGTRDPSGTLEKLENRDL